MIIQLHNPHTMTDLVQFETGKKISVTQLKQILYHAQVQKRITFNFEQLTTIRLEKPDKVKYYIVPLGLLPERDYNYAVKNGIPFELMGQRSKIKRR